MDICFNINVLYFIIDSVQRESTMDSHYTIHLLGVLSGESNNYWSFSFLYECLLRPHNSVSLLKLS